MADKNYAWKHYYALKSAVSKPNSRITYRNARIQSIDFNRFGVFGDKSYIEVLLPGGREMVSVNIEEIKIDATAR